MTMVETPVPVQEIEITDEEEHNHDDEWCHLYNGFAFFHAHTLCGLPRSEDSHGNRHPGEGPILFWKGQELACPLCGVKLCMTCALMAS